MKTSRPSADEALPDFLFFGPERTGTTWIHRYLAERGDVRLPKLTKELFFFDYKFAQGLDWYRAQFQTAQQQRIMAEVAPTYFVSTAAAERIRLAAPQAQVVCTLREPIERAYSQYRYLRGHGANLPLPEAVHTWPQILDGSRYARHLERLYGIFGRERVHVLLLDDLSRDAPGYVHELCRILGLPVVEASDALLATRINAAGVQKRPQLAQLASRIRLHLHRSGLGWLSVLAGRAGARKLIFAARDTRTAEETEMTAKERNFLVDRLGGEREALERLLGRALLNWHPP